MNEAADRCGSLRSFLGMALKGHVFASAPTNNPNECFIRCQQEKLCQSFNFMIKEHVCELNNRSKEAKPHEFVKDPERMYMTNGPTRIPLGSTAELPAESCAEIKASEGKRAVSGIVWLDPTNSGKAVVARCNMETKVADFCVQHSCLNEGKCVTTYINYTCICNPWWTGTYCGSLLPGDFEGSKILKDYGAPEYSEKLSTFLEPATKNMTSYRWVRCFSAYEDGKSLDRAREKCSNKVRTLTLVRVKSYIFGGYTSLSSFGYTNCSYAIDREAFIFSLHNTQGYSPIKLSLKDTGTEHAVYRCDNAIVKFGQGPDLVIWFKWGTTKPQSYNVPSGCSERKACPFFAGRSRFNTSDIEIFYVEPSSP
ncbi:uncharacterized protein LOC114958926 [Acropora millepora]|nr:uncharacterized protein LOC114958926 [Acropora millepora]